MALKLYPSLDIPYFMPENFSTEPSLLTSSHWHYVVKPSLWNPWIKLDETAEYRLAWCLGEIEHTYSGYLCPSDTAGKFHHVPNPNHTSLPLDFYLMACLMRRNNWNHQLNNIHCQYNLIFTQYFHIWVLHYLLRYFLILHEFLHRPITDEEVFITLYGDVVKSLKTV